MSTQRVCRSALAAAVVGVIPAVLFAADMGTGFTYQGYLQKDAVAVTDTCDFRFGLWDLDAVGTLKGSQTILDVSVEKGVFTTTLDFGAGAIDGTGRWLAIEVQCTGDADFVPLAPRVKLTPAPHAMALPGLRTQETSGAPNVIGGHCDNTVNTGLVGATIGGGGGSGSPNRVVASYGTIGGGRWNEANGEFSTIGGGEANAAWQRATIGGGDGNIATYWGVVDGGTSNRAEDFAAVGGGLANHATGLYGVVGGGYYNEANGDWATVPGGSSNMAGGSFSFASGNRAKVRDSNPLSPYYSGDDDGDEGTFIWADSTDASFASTGPNQFLIRAAGGVGIGTNVPDSAAMLDVAGRIEMDGLKLTMPTTAGRVLTSDASGVGSWQPESDPQVGTIGANYLSKWDGAALAQSGVFESGGNVGIGTSTPSQRLDVAGTIETDGFRLTTATSSGRVLTSDANGIASWQVEADPQVGAMSNNAIPKWDGSALVAANIYDSGGNVGIGWFSPTNRLSVSGNADITGNLGVGDNTPDARLDAEQNNGIVATFNRTGGDGRVITIERDGADQGGIQVNAGIVSISPFTGTHFAWASQSIELGHLVVMTGDNRRFHDSPQGEPLYSIEPSREPNDPRCLGAFLDLNEPGSPAGNSNPHLVMAVGNGEMWVVDSGREISPGDYLISSDVVGHAMLDDESRFPVGHIVARASEPVRWSAVKETVDGRKHKRISVLFESFDRGSAEFDRKLRETNRRLEEQNRVLEERLMAVERTLAELMPVK